MHILGRTVVALVLGLALGCGALEKATTNTERRPLDRYFNIRPISESPWEEDSRWQVQHYAPESGAVCHGGKAYRTAFRASPQAQSPDVMLFLQGGGACWNSVTCALGMGNREPDIHRLDGILELPDPEVDDGNNSVRQAFSRFHVMYAPYCDGSLFGGDKDVPEPGGRWRRHHGLQNLSAALMALKEKVPNPRKVVIVGISGGGYGTLFAMMPTLLAFPNSDIYVVNDSGPGLMNEGNRLQRNEAVTNWNLDENVPDGCVECDPQLTPLIPLVLGREPRLRRVGLFSSVHDFTIRTFLALTPEGYREELLKQTGRAREQQPDRFKRFVVAGNEHTMVNRPRFFDTRVADITLAQWILQLVDDDPAWADVVEQ